MRAPIALTMGEPAGIGGEIALKAWRDRAAGVPPFFLIDNPARLQQLAADLSLAVPVQAISKPSDAAACFENALPLLPLSHDVKAHAGKPETATAAAVIESIERAVKLTQSREASALVTNPIQKSVLTAAGFAHPGHTEFLAALASARTKAVMMLACRELRVVPVTIHVALAEAARRLTSNTIIYCGRVTAAALARDFGIARPCLAFAGLNPHGGEKGGMGREEIDIIEPALSQLRGDLHVSRSSPNPDQDD